MAEVLSAIARHARFRPSAIAIRGHLRLISFRSLEQSIGQVARRLDGRVVGLLVDNGPQWALFDLAAQLRGAACVPLPGFFSDSQIAHVVRQAGIDMLVTDQPARVSRILNADPDEAIQLPEGRMACFRPTTAGSAPPAPHIAKVTYTSGTTGQPRGVCLRQSVLDRVAASLQEAAQARECDRALCLLPLATLLENIGGLYAPLLAGAEICMPGTADTGLLGASGVDIPRLTATLDVSRPTSIILVPQILAALVAAAERGWSVPASLRMIAVGGAPIAARLLERAERCGLPVYEGYGLSEAASVVTLNRPGSRRPGTVGKPLAHTRVAIGEDGEIHVGGALFDGYLGAPARESDSHPTGDLGRLDADGYLVLTGRKKSAYATAFGRNVLPDWIERAMLEEPAIGQIAVFGEARPYNVAVVVSASRSYAAVAGAIERVNRSLPDYARVRRFVLADQPFTPANGGLTASGKVRRQSIWSLYRQMLETLYEEELNAVS